MVKSIHSKQVVLVNQSKGFDWKTMTIADKVHPNQKGREQMAKVWFAALRKLLQTPPHSYSVELMPYKVLPSGDSLYAHVFRPKKNLARSAVAWFFAGGWKYGSPLQFYRESAHLAEKGLLAVSFDYRISYLYHSSQENALEDARDAIEWLREGMLNTWGHLRAKSAVEVRRLVLVWQPCWQVKTLMEKIACRYPTCCCWNIRHWQSLLLVFAARCLRCCCAWGRKTSSPRWSWLKNM